MGLDLTKSGQDLLLRNEENRSLSTTGIAPG